MVSEEETSAASAASTSLRSGRSTSDDTENHSFADVSWLRPNQYGIRGLLENPFIFGVTCFASLGGFLFGYDQGVVSNILVLESFGAAFPHIYMNAGLKGWYVSTLLLGAWIGSLLNGPICDMIGRKRSIMYSVVIFLLGSALQTGAQSQGYLFGGRFVAGLSIGAITHVVPMYLAEISKANIRGSAVAFQQLSISLGILLSYWIAYGTSHIGGTRCAPNIPYTGPLLNGKPTFDAFNDVPPGGCTGQTNASWRIPVGVQMFPALCLCLGMFYMPYSPRWLMEKDRDDEALMTLSRLRHKPMDDFSVRFEFLEIKAQIMFARESQHALYFENGYWRKLISNYVVMVASWPKFRRLAIGCLVMFYQQFMGSSVIIYYAPTIFTQLGLNPNTTSLLATGVYSIINTLSTLPAIMLLDKVGRRPLLMAGAVGCFVSLTVVGSLIVAFGTNWHGHAVAGRVAIAFVYIYDINFSYSWAPIGWVLPSEIFPLSLRSTGISITTSCTWMSNFIISLISLLMLQFVESGGTYYLFAGFAVLAFITTYLFIPETAGKTLEEMDIAFGDNASEKDRERMALICRELGLPENTLMA